jgi:hypothetical protein
MSPNHMKYSPFFYLFIKAKTQLGILKLNQVDVDILESIFPITANLIQNIKKTLRSGLFIF